MISLNSSSTNSLNSSLSSTFGKHWRQRCVLEAIARLTPIESAEQSCPLLSSTFALWFRLTVKSSFGAILAAQSLAEVTSSDVLSPLDPVLSTVQHSTGSTVPFILLLHSWSLLMLWRLSKNAFFSLFKWLAKDWSSFFPFPIPSKEKKT